MSSPGREGPAVELGELGALRADVGHHAADLLRVGLRRRLPQAGSLAFPARPTVFADARMAGVS